MLPIQIKISTACKYAGLSQNELAAKLGYSSSAFSQRMKTGKFSDKDFDEIAKALDCEYYSGFKFRDGTKVE